MCVLVSVNGTEHMLNVRPVDVLTPRSGAGYFILATIHVHGEPNVFDASVQADSIQFHACGAARGAVRSRTRGPLQQRRGRQGGRRCGD